MSPLAPTLQAFFTTYLTGHRGASAHTIATYRDTWRLLLTYLRDQNHHRPADVDFTDLSAETITGFLRYLETDRYNGPTTRNARLAAIHALFHYAAYLHPEHAALIGRLRAPLFSDPSADQGTHVIRTSIRVGRDILDAVQEGYRINLPIRVVQGGGPVSSLVSSDNPAIVVEAVKLAEDRSGDLVVRLYEARGALATGTIELGCDVSRIVETDLLERTLEHEAALVTVAGAQATLRLRRFQIVTLRVERG